MARVLLLSLLFFAILLISEARNGPEASPAPAPHSGADAPHHFFRPPPTSAPSSAPSPGAHSVKSPPAPPPPEETPPSFPADTTINEEQNAGHGVPEGASHSDGKAGRVAGTVVAVVIGAAVVVLAFIIYRKRQENIRRSQYGFAARREML